MKQFPPSEQVEDTGYIYIATVCNRMGCIWRKLTEHDKGIDGHIEIGVNHQATSKIIGVQSKAGPSYIHNATADKFDFYAKEKDLKYWLQANVPVILVVHDPDANLSYWVDIREYRRLHPEVMSSPHKITFDKKKDVFSRDSYPQLCGLVGIGPLRGVPVVPKNYQETVHSNLLRVVRVPEVVWASPTTYTFKQQVREALQMDLPPFIIKRSHLWTFSDLNASSSPLSQACNIHQVSSHDFRLWRSDSQKRRWFVELLNEAIRDHCVKLGLRYDEDHRRFFFPPDGGKERKVTWRGGASKPRTVAAPVVYGNPKTVQYWYHHSVRLSVESIGEHWYLQVEPAYTFTRDGENYLAGREVGPLATWRKARDFNPNVLNHLLFWAEFLSKDKNRIEIACGNQTIAIEQVYEIGLTDFGIPEDKRDFRALAAIEDKIDWQALMSDAAVGDDEDEEIAEADHDNF